jgi:hypothetical protein
MFRCRDESNRPNYHVGNNFLDSLGELDVVARLRFHFLCVEIPARRDIEHVYAYACEPPGKNLRLFDPPASPSAVAIFFALRILQYDSQGTVTGTVQAAAARTQSVADTRQKTGLSLGQMSRVI